MNKHDCIDCTALFELLACNSLLMLQQNSNQPAPGSKATAGTALCAHKPFPFAVPHVYLDVSIQPGTTHVTSIVDYVPLDTTCPQQQLHLRGEDLQLVELQLNGVLQSNWSLGPE